jgi:hypothetical protein
VIVPGAEEERVLFEEVAVSAISAKLLIEGNKPNQTTEEVDIVHRKHGAWLLHH